MTKRDKEKSKGNEESEFDAIEGIGVQYGVQICFLSHYAMGWVSRTLIETSFRIILNFLPLRNIFRNAKPIFSCLGMLTLEYATGGIPKEQIKGARKEQFCKNSYQYFCKNIVSNIFQGKASNGLCFSTFCLNLIAFQVHVSAQSICPNIFEQIDLESR